MVLPLSVFLSLSIAGVLLNWLVMLLIGILAGVGNGGIVEAILIYAFTTLKIFVYLLYLLLAYEVRRFRFLLFLLLVEIVFMVLGDYVIYRFFWKSLLS